MASAKRPWFSNSISDAIIKAALAIESIIFDSLELFESAEGPKSLMQQLSSINLSTTVPKCHVIIS
jgi:hypothetical protein